MGGAGVWTERFPEDLLRAVREGGIGPAGEDTEIRVFPVGDSRLPALDPEEIEREVRLVLRGGSLVLASAGGERERLLDDLHLRAGRVVEAGRARPTREGAAAGFPDVVLRNVQAVSGPGHALLRLERNCVALGAPRGEGAVVLLGSPELLHAAEHGVLRAAIGWIFRQGGRGMR